MNTIQLQASDGHSFSAHREVPGGPIRGAVVIVQEILGVTPYIQRVCKRFADAGFVATAPALFDRFERDVSLGMSSEDVARGRELRAKAGFDLPLLDIASAVAASAEFGPVAVVGFCWGGTLAWRMAHAEGVSAVVCYYGGQIPDFLDEAPTVPVLLHFGVQDPVLPPEARERIASAYPDIPSHLYPAGHAFDNDARDDHDPESSRIAHERTVSFLRSVFER